MGVGGSNDRCLPVTEEAAPIADMSYTLKLAFQSSLLGVEDQKLGEKVGATVYRRGHQMSNVISTSTGTGLVPGRFDNTPLPILPRPPLLEN